MGPYQTRIGYVLDQLPQDTSLRQRVGTVMAVCNAYRGEGAARTAARILEPFRDLPVVQIGQRYQGSRTYGEILAVLIRNR